MNGISHTSKQTPQGDYITPPEIFNPLNEIFRFNLDVAADSRNTKCPEFYTAQENGLRLPWRVDAQTTGRMWCNPPYGRKNSYPWPKSEIADWLLKGWTEIDCDNCEIAVFLLKFSLAAWFWEFAAPNACYVRQEGGGRIRFIDPQTGKPAGSPPGESLLIVMGEPVERQDEKMREIGWYRMKVEVGA